MSKANTGASVAFMATHDQKQRLVDLGYKKKAEVDKMTPQQIQDALKLHDLAACRKTFLVENWGAVNGGGAQSRRTPISWWPRARIRRWQASLWA